MVRREPLTLGRTEALLTDPDTGPYRYPSSYHSEILRELRHAVAEWGEDKNWEDVSHDDWRRLIRKRLEALIAAGHHGYSAGKITVRRVIRVVNILRGKHVSRTAAQWPEDWEAQIVSHWKGLKKTEREPELSQHEYSPEQKRRIQKAADFDPRLNLLLVFALDFPIDRVTEAKRSGLRFGDLSRGEDYGTLTIESDGNQAELTIHLTEKERSAIARAIRLDGYLGDIEEKFLAREVKDYHLFPTGYVVGRVALLKGKKHPRLKLSEHTNYDARVTGSWVRKNFLRAEKRAGVEHIEGRSTLAMRRGSERTSRAHDEHGTAQFEESTGWPSVNGQLREAKARLMSASSDEHFRQVGQACQHALISLAQAVYDPQRHPSVDEVTPSSTDAARMLAAFFAYELRGDTNEATRAYAKSALKLAVALYHDRNADRRTAQMCLMAASGVANIVATVAGKHAE